MKQSTLLQPVFRVPQLDAVQCLLGWGLRPLADGP